MKTVMRPRYYCDHCKRGNGSPSAMLRHEESCTANPARVCRFCGAGSSAALMAVRVLILTEAPQPVTVEGWKARMDRLRDEVENCPGCILAAIRQSGVQKRAWEPDDPEGGVYPWEGPLVSMHWKAPNGSDSMLGFNFKDEKKDYLEGRSQDRCERECY